MRRLLLVLHTILTPIVTLISHSLQLGVQACQRSVRGTTTKGDGPIEIGGEVSSIEALEGPELYGPGRLSYFHWLS